MRDPRCMVSTILVTVGSLVGVLLGGALSLVAQRSVENSAARRHAASLMEGRRGERLAHLLAFIETAQEAERLAIAIHKYDAAGEAVSERTEALLDQLWMRLRAVQLICPVEVSAAARELAGESHDVLRHGPGDQTVTAVLRPSRAKLIALARTDLEQVRGDNHHRQ
jgi:hypothetical protein